MLAKLLVLFAALAAVTAFAPTRAVSRTSELSMAKAKTVKQAPVDETGLIGVATEIGGFFDPLNLSKGKDEATLKWYRAVELKHGRVAMLASLGVIIQGLDTGIIPNPAFHETNMWSALNKVYTECPQTLVQIGIAIAAVEVLTASIENRSDRPGDFGWDPANIRPKSEEKLDKMQLKELKNGRLAMLSIAGMAYQSYLTGQGTLEQLASGHISPFGDGQGAF